MEQQKKRLVYIDCLRGFSMIFVLYQHLLTFSLDVPPSWFADIVRSFRMPLFFFISGFVSYKALFDWNLQNFGKIQRQLEGNSHEKAHFHFHISAVRTRRGLCV